MTERTVRSPGGDTPPAAVFWDDREPLQLIPLAAEVCRRYQEEFPDETGRYGGAGNEWCVHDNQYLLCWGAEAVDGYVEMEEQVAWLARVLESRHFPLDRLARDLDIGADVVLAQVSGTPGSELAGVLAGAAAFVRSHDTFLAEA